MLAEGLSTCSDSRFDAGLPPRALRDCRIHPPCARRLNEDHTPLQEGIFLDMLSCMRTTIDINDELLRAAKAHAAGERKTLKATVEQALRELLAGPRQAVCDVPPIPVFRGRGVQPGVDLTDNAALEAIMNAEP